MSAKGKRERFSTPCLVCGRVVYHLQNAPVHPDLLEGAVYFEMVGGYGSGHDTSVFSGVVCKNCITKAVKKNRLTHEGNAL